MSDLKPGRAGSASIVTQAYLAKLAGVPAINEIWVLDANGTEESKVILNDATEITAALQANSDLQVVIYGPGTHAPHVYDACPSVVYAYFVGGAQVVGSDEYNFGTEETPDVYNCSIGAKGSAVIMSHPSVVPTGAEGVDTYGMLCYSGYFLIVSPTVDNQGDSSADEYNSFYCLGGAQIISNPFVYHGNITRDGGACAVVGGFVITAQNIIGAVSLSGVSVIAPTQISDECTGYAFADNDLIQCTGTNRYSLNTLLDDLCTAASVTPTPL